MSATTPGIRRIWMETVVQCVDQRIARISHDSGPMERASSVADAAVIKSDLSRQNPASLTDNALASRKTKPGSQSDDATSNSCQTVSDKAELELVSERQLLSSDGCAPPAAASYSDTVSHADSHSTDVCSILTRCLYNYCLYQLS